MALPREKYDFAPLPLELAGPQDRAGKYTIEELQRMLEPLLVASAAEAPESEAKWPIGYGVGAGLLVSLALWAAIAAGAAYF